MPQILCGEFGALLRLDHFLGVAVEQNGEQQAGNGEDDGRGEVRLILCHAAGHQQVDERQPEDRQEPEQQLRRAEAIAVKGASVVGILRHCTAERAVGNVIGGEEDHVKAVDDGDNGDLGRGRPVADRQPEQDV